MQNEHKIYEEKPKDNSLGLELSQIQNQNHVQRSIKEHMNDGHVIDNKNIEPDQNNAQNQLVNESYFEMEFNKLNGSNSQLWK